MYNDSHLAEFYDQVETYTDDVGLIRSLLQDKGHLRILEPFCGTGRILIPLLQDGHEVVGLDCAPEMLKRATLKINQLPEATQEKSSLIEMDVLKDLWPTGFDLVLLGGNCLYELATPVEQRHCIAAASRAVKPGGYLFLDNNHMEGDLDPTWQDSSIHPAFPSGVCLDGTRLESTRQTIWFDAPRRLVRFARRTRIMLPSGECIDHDYVEQKHPVSYGEMHAWVESHGFVIQHTFGERDGSSYTPTSSRAIFWARRSDA